MGVLLIQDRKCTEMLGGKTRQLSYAFREVLAKQLSPKLIRKVKTAVSPDKVYDKIYLLAGRYSDYEVYRNGISALPFRIETKTGGSWVGECHVIWKSMPGKKIYAPWDCMKNEDIECGLLIDRKNTDALNRALSPQKEKKGLPLFIGERTPVFGEAVVGLNKIKIGVYSEVTSAMLLETVYLCDTFTREYAGTVITEGMPRQKGDFEISVRLFSGKGAKTHFEAFLTALEKASFPLRYVKLNEK